MDASDDLKQPTHKHTSRWPPVHSDDSDEDESGFTSSEEGDSQSQPEEDSESSDDMANLAFSEIKEIKKMDTSSLPRSREERKQRAIKIEMDLKKKRKEAGKRDPDAPVELSSKIPVSRKKQVVHVQQKEVRDPRFQNISGDYNGENFERNYAFLDDIRQNEMTKLKQAIKKEKDPKKQEKLSKALSIMIQRAKLKEEKQKNAAILKEQRQKENKAVKEGKKKFYLKKSMETRRYQTNQCSRTKEADFGRQIQQAARIGTIGQVHGTETAQNRNARQTVYA